MPLTLLIVRIIHIGSGVFWAGTLMFFASLLEPSIRAAGPEGMRVMRELQARRFTVIMPLIGLVTVLSGLDLIRRVFPGGPSAWVATATGKTLVAGALAAITVLIIGVFFVVPLVKKAPQLMQRMSSETQESAKAATMAELMAVRGRLTMLARLNAALIGVTVIAMAIARYVG